MKKTAALIVNLRFVFAAVFIALIIFSCFSAGWVEVENDIAAYLPDSAEAKHGLTIMAEEFTAYATADVMVEDISPAEAESLRGRLSEIDGVFSVSFENSPDHYKDGKALYNITFSGPVNDSTRSAMDELKSILGRYEHSISSSFSGLADVLGKEMIGVGIIVVFVVVGVLIFTSSTYAEIPVLLGTFLAAAVINLGTNFLLGRISFVSNSVTIVLQLALSVDYAIILCNRYKEEHETKPIKEAVISALAFSIPEISASSLTTIAGLTAMTLMQFKLGMDMGIALIKSIVFSLLSVFLFMPALLMWLGKAMDMTKHRNFVPEISFAGKFAHAVRFILPPLFAAFVVFAYISYGNVKYDYSSELVEIVHRNEDDLAARRIKSTFGSNNLLAVLVPAGDYAREAALIKDIESCSEVNSVLGLAAIDAMDGYKLGDMINFREFMDLAGIDETTARSAFAYFAAGRSDRHHAAEDLEDYRAPIVDLFLMIHDLAGSDIFDIPADKLALIDELYGQLKMGQEQLRGENYSRIVVFADLPTQGDNTFAFLERLHVLAAKYYPEGVVLTGQSVSAKGFYDTFEGDIRIVGLFSIGFVMLILLFTFRSLGMPLLLITVIQGSIWINFALCAWTDKYVFFMCYLITSAIQMGANIDYAIVISSRYNSLRSEGTAVREAIIKTLNFAFPTIVTSGLMMVIAGLVIGFRVSQPVIAGMGMHVGIGTSVSLLLVNTVLPAILVFGDAFIRATTVSSLPGHRVPLLLRISRVLAGVLLAAAAVYSAVILPGCFNGFITARDERGNLLTDLYSSSGELLDLAGSMHSTQSELDDLKYSFAEGLMADYVGADALSEAEELIAEGQAQLSFAKSQLSAGYEELAPYEQQYAEGLAAYEDGARQLADAQAQYDAGLAKIADARVQYAEGEARLAQAEPLYNRVVPYYSEYMQLQSAYDEAVAAGNEREAAALGIRLAGAKLVFETQLGSTGMSLSQIVSDYESGRAQLESAAAEIAAGEAQLDDAKIQLEEGYAKLNSSKIQLEEAAVQLNEARAQLGSGAWQIQQGQARLDDAMTQLEQGRELMAEKEQGLADSMQQLDIYSDDARRLHSGAQILLRLEDIAGIAGRGADDEAVVAAAYRYFSAQLDELAGSARLARILMILLPAAAAMALLSGLLSLFRVYGPARWYSAIAAAFAGAGLYFWDKYCSLFGSGYMLAAGCLLCTAAVFTLLMSLSRKAERRTDIS